MPSQRLDTFARLHCKSYHRTHMKSDSQPRMKMRWRLILCLWGLSLFALLTYTSIQNARMQGHPSRYFWWGTVRLDPAPLTLPPPPKPCVEEPGEVCVGFDPDYLWRHTGLVEEALILSAFPAFVVTLPLVHGLARFGVNEVLSFMIAMPITIMVWFYTVGWLLDRRRYKRSLRQALASSPNSSATEIGD